MNRQTYKKPPQWWSPKVSPGRVRLWRALRLRRQRTEQRLLNVEVNGAEHVRRALEEGKGVLITPNHSAHADCFSLYGAADAIGTPFYVMVAWQVFDRGNWIKRLALRHHGCFSVDREGTDLNALRQAREVLQSAPFPLVIFPEGEVYHINDRVTPFREGPAAIALMAARKAKREIVCVPCGMKYRYVKDPTPELLDLLDRLETALFWRPRPDLTFSQRIYHLAEGILALKEVEFLGRTSSGSLPQRLDHLMQFILGRIEARYGLDPSGTTIPERIKALRKHAVEQLMELPSGDPARKEYLNDLDDVFLVVQAFSYPGDYVAEQPDIERAAETLDKFEEDLLGAPTATIRGERKVTVTLGEPIPAAVEGNKKTAAATLTRTIESSVQELLDRMQRP